MINRQDSRHKIKRSSFSGVVPTIHTASNDFTDGTWLNTDLREAEFFYNIPDKKLWIGTGTSSIEIAQIGSTTSGNSLEQTLAIGNDSGLQSIIMGTGTSINIGANSIKSIIQTPLINTFDITSQTGTSSITGIHMNSGIQSTIVLSTSSGSLDFNQETSYNGINTYKSIGGSTVAYTKYQLGNVSTTTIGTFSMATITMVDNTSLLIKGCVNGNCTSPNRNMGATFFASFIKYGGFIHQNGTTDIILKDGYGDGTTPKVWTDNINIYIGVRTFSQLTSTFTTSYEILY